MKIIILIILITCLSSCSNPTFKDRKQCSIYLHFQEITINDQILEIIDPQLSSCDCRLYHFGLDYIGPVTEAKPFTVSDCQGLIGHTPVDYVGHINDAEAVRRYLASRSKKNTINSKEK